MKIRKRRELLDFRALAGDETSDFDDLEPLDSGPDFDLDPIEPPEAAPSKAQTETAPADPDLGPGPTRVRIDGARPPSITAQAPRPPAAPTPPRVARVEEPRPTPQPAPQPSTSVVNFPPEDRNPAGIFADEPVPQSVAAVPPQRPAQTSEVAVTPTPEPPGPPEPPTASVEASLRPAVRPLVEPAAEARPPAADPTPRDAPIIERTTAGPGASVSSGRRHGARRAATSQPATSAIPKAGAAQGQATSGTPIYIGAGVVSVLWACAPIAFAIGYRREVMPFEYEPFALAVFGLLVVGPAGLIWIAAYLLRQGQILAAEARRAKSMADDMVSPALIAAGRAGDMAVVMREEIARASQTAKEAQETLLSLRQALAAESDRLAEATGASARQAQDLTEVLGQERAQMSALAQSLEGHTGAARAAIAHQTQLVTDASDLAVTQLREAEALLAARSADLTAAAGLASDAARTAGEDLTRHIARLDTAGVGVAEQINAVEAGLAEQRAALVAATHGLRADQEIFAAEAESQTAKLSEFIGHARGAATEMGERAIKGADALHALIAEAAEQFREFAAQASLERDAFGASTQQSIEAVAAGAADERAKLEAQTRASIVALSQAAEETREAAQRHAEAARLQVDQLAEAAFAAGQRANQSFEARLEEARELIERSSQMVEQAGAATARKLEEGAETARGALTELEHLLGVVEERASRLPVEARRQAEEVRKALSQSMDELMQQARRTAEETGAIDQAFQDRVFRNYEMLSEAVRLMGTVAGTAAPPPPPVRERRPPVRNLSETATDLSPPLLPAKAPAGEKPGARPRLKLTPTATDEEFSNVFDSAGGRIDEAAEPSEGWTWKELLSSIDSGGGDAAAGKIEESLISEIVAMGIDPAALLPRTRVEEIVEMVQAGDADSRRLLVRRLAPAATRRLARRLFTDAELKQRVRKYVGRYDRLLAEAAWRDEEGLELGGLLASDAGRSFLLLDAAAGEAD